ncbi:hypothetical protein [Streptomyces sp. ISL-100]|uniref:hypothetical protein n=1 Tax=Streptomyces sp. ISL-100 TaxID=2819173 RepID=UPI001BE75216|nr:hypothetical protein [Streptomyces sp. ISL-100]MBT2398061.1 hypothetical protein [Streptomyces sp. ISL-100]
MLPTALPMKQIGAILKAQLGDAANRVPTRSIPDTVVRIAAVFRRELRPIVPVLGYAKKVSSDRARKVLGWTARDAEEAIVASGESMVAKGLLKN